MLKAKRLVLALALMLSVPALSPTIAEAKCSGWTTYETGSYFCDDSEWCGINPFKGVEKRALYQERTCDVGGKQQRETRTTYQKNGCC